MRVVSTQKKTHAARKFEVADRVTILEGKYKGCTARVVDYHAAFVYHAYTVQEDKSGKLLFHYGYEVGKCSNCNGTGYYTVLNVGEYSEEPMTMRCKRCRDSENLK